MKESPQPGGRFAGTLGRLKLKVGEGITGWVARELQPVALEREAYRDPRFKDLALVKMGRLSVMPVPDGLWGPLTGT